MITSANFENFKISPDFPIKFRKSHQISKNYLKSSESYGQKPLGGSLNPGLNSVKDLISILLYGQLELRVVGNHVDNKIHLAYATI